MLSLPAFLALSALCLPHAQSSDDSAPPPPPPPFTSIGPRALPGVVTTCGSPDKNWILEVNGGGVLLADFDLDSHTDCLIVDGSTLERVSRNEPGLPPRLFLGKGDCTFQPAPAEWTVPPGRFGMAGTTGDWNGDGRLDLVITEWGGVRILLNIPAKGFVPVAESGLAQGEWATSAAPLDFDRDGKLDLVVVNYLEFDTQKIKKKGAGDCNWKGHPVMCGPEGLPPTFDRLYRGKGDGTFEDVTEKARFKPTSAGFGLGVMTLDYDDDGDTDIYVANDSTPNFLWENQGDGTFSEVGLRRGVSHDANGREQASMGIACGDMNGDLRPDLFVTNFSGENSVLYLSAKSGGYRERSSQAQLAGPSLRFLKWGTAMADFDLDGDLDLSVMNGHVYPEADRPGTDTSYTQEPQFFANDGAGRFTAAALAQVAPQKARASAAADLDDDGDLDLVAVGVEGPVLVFENTAVRPKDAHWLRVRLATTRENRFGIGAKVTLEWEGHAQAGEMRTAGGFQAAVPPEVHFGLVTEAKSAAVRVRWPSGFEQVEADVALDRVITITERAP